MRFMQQDTEPEDMCKNYRYILVLLWLWMYYCILGLGLSLFVHTHYSFCVITYVAVYEFVLYAILYVEWLMINVHKT
jgi:hypothetical protein